MQPNSDNLLLVNFLKIVYAGIIVNAEITAAQAEWDSIPDDDERKDTSSALYIPRPEDITLEE